MSKRWTITWLLFFLLHCVLTAGSQVPQYKFTTYTTAQGLCSNLVSDCVLDRNSFLWIATENGLSRFDGVHFKNYLHVQGDSTSLPFNLIQRVYCDYKNRIWISGNEGIAYFDPINNKFTRLQLQKRDNRLSRQNAIVVDNDSHKIWYADNGRLNAFNLDKWIVEPTTLLVEHSEALNIFLSQKKDIWLYDVNKGFIYTYNIFSKQSEKVNTARRGRSMAEDAFGNTWMGCYQEGITDCRDTTKKNYFFTDNNNNSFGHTIRDMLIPSNFTGDSLLWIASAESGIHFFNLHTKTYLPFSLNHSLFNPSGLPDDKINKLYNTNEDILWVCTSSGIVKLNKNDQQFSRYTFPFLQKKMPANIIGISNKMNNTCWLATYGKGLIQYDVTTGEVLQWTFYNPQLPAENQPNTLNRQMVKDQKGNEWVAGDNGLLKIDTNGRISSMPLNTNKLLVIFTCLYPEGDSVLWCGSAGSGLIKYTIRNKSYQFYRDVSNNQPPLQNGIYKILPDKSGTLWLATKNGLYSFNTHSSELTLFANNKLPGFTNSSNIIYSFDRDDTGNFWLATIGGLVLFNPVNKAFENLQGSGMPSSLCTAVRRDANGFIWVLSAAGLYKIDPQSHSSIVYTERDGVYTGVSDQLNYIIDIPGNKWATCARDGYAAFDPLLPTTSRKLIPTHITEIKINNQPVNIDFDSLKSQPLILSYKQNEIGFAFSGIDYSNEHPVDYSCRLIGYDTAWITLSGKNEITYTNLAAGSYSFEVMAFHEEDRKAKEPSTVFLFRIRPPFWQTWWFASLLLLMAAAAVTIFIRSREKRRASEQALRDKIARDLHDDVGSSLSGINLFSKMALQKADDSPTKELLEKIADRSENMVNAMSDLVWSVNPDNDSFDKLIIRMRSYALDMLEDQQIRVQFSVPAGLSKIKMGLDRRKDFYLIYKEAINNIAKYASPSEVLIEFSTETNRLQMKIADNGRGFDPSKANTGNGIRNMKARAGTIQATLQIDSSEGKGTSIALSVPL